MEINDRRGNHSQQRRYRLAKVLVVIGFALSRAYGINNAAGLTEDCLTELIDRANEAFQERFYEDQLRQAISAYERLLPGLELFPVQSQAFFLNRLSQACYELTTFSDGYTPADRELLLKGKTYGFRSLQLDPGFAEWEKKNFRKAVSLVNDPAALLWTTHNWGAYLAFDPLQGILSVDNIKTMYERCIVVEATYWGASAFSALGSLLVVTPAALGGNLEQGRTFLEAAIGLAPSYLENRVVYAQYWGYFSFIPNIQRMKIHVA